MSSCTMQNSYPSCSFVRKFRKMNVLKATKDNQQDHKKLGQKDNQRCGTESSPTSPRFLLLTVVVEDNFVYINIIFLISHTTYTLKFFKNVFRKKLILLKDLIT